MKVLPVIYIVFAFSGATHAQTDSSSVDSTSKIERFKLRDAKFAIKTDALALLNSVLSEGGFDASVASEVCFKQQYSLQLNTAHESFHSTSYKRRGFRFGTEFKRYIPCNTYSVVYYGVYFSFENAGVTVDRLMHENKFLKYRESIFEAGMSGGLKAKVSGHWVINPSAYAGISNIYSSRILEAFNTSYIEKPDMLIVRVVLGIGYRF